MGGCVSKSSSGAKSAKAPKKGKFDPLVLSEEDIKAIMDNTKLSRAEIIALHKNFLKECPSGKLNKKDFLKLFNEMHTLDKKKQKADKFCDYVFNVIDSSKSGSITFKDFVLVFSHISFGEFKDRCEFAFKLFDLDKDGKISKSEMTKVLEALYQLSGVDAKGKNAPAKRVDEIMQKLNPDKKDQKFLSKDKFIEACKNDENIKKYFIDSVFNINEEASKKTEVVDLTPAVVLATQAIAVSQAEAVEGLSLEPEIKIAPLENSEIVLTTHTIVERSEPEISASDEIIEVVHHVTKTTTTTIETTTTSDGDRQVTTETVTTSELAH